MSGRHWAVTTQYTVYSFSFWYSAISRSPSYQLVRGAPPCSGAMRTARESMEPVVWYEGSGLSTKHYLHADERGSVIATSDGSGAGTIYTYGPYGEPAGESGTPVPLWTGSRFRYTGQIALHEVQLYHYKARVYDPVLGRFLQVDPVGYKDDWNLYAYVTNDPLNKTDPMGLTSRDEKTFGKPQKTPTPGHDKASVNLVKAMEADAIANGETVDDSHYNRTARKATEGAVKSEKRPDGVVNSTARDGTKVHRFGEAASPSQTVDGEKAKWAGDGAKVSPGHKLIVFASKFVRLTGKLSGIASAGLIAKDVNDGVAAGQTKGEIAYQASGAKDAVDLGLMVGESYSRLD